MNVYIYIESWCLAERPTKNIFVGVLLCVFALCFRPVLSRTFLQPVRRVTLCCDFVSQGPKRL